MYKHTFAALCAAGAAAAPASASVFFTFDDPSTALEVRHEAPQMIGEDGTMTYGMATMPTIEFVVDATQEGGSVHTFDANLFWTDWEVGAVTTNLFGVQSAMVKGAFEFIDLDDGDTILSGTFEMGFVVEVLGAGSVITSSMGGGTLEYIAGKALLDEEPVVNGMTDDKFLAPRDGVYTLTDITFDNAGAKTVQLGGEEYLGSFSANAAFTGTAEIPAPGPMALCAAGGIVAFRRRRA